MVQLGRVVPRSWKNPGPVGSIPRSRHWVVEAEDEEPSFTMHDLYFRRAYSAKRVPPSRTHSASRSSRAASWFPTE